MPGHFKAFSFGKNFPKNLNSFLKVRFFQEFGALCVYYSAPHLDKNSLGHIFGIRKPMQFYTFFLLVHQGILIRQKYILAQTEQPEYYLVHSSCSLCIPKKANLAAFQKGNFVKLELFIFKE